MKKFDFSGWATKNDIRCTDGRTIKQNAFIGNDGTEVPLVWNHQHNDPSNVLGHARLENRKDGVYAYCTFNDSPSGRDAKEAVKHGDIKSLSIYANQLKQDGMDVVHGVIRELSLVMAGANSGAFIDFVVAHGDGSQDGVIVGYDENIVIYHSDEDDEDVNNNDLEGDDDMAGKLQHSEEEPKSVQDIIDSMTEEQQEVMYQLVAEALDDDGDDDDDYDDYEGEEDMKHSVFENDNQTNTLCHADQEEILKMAKSSSVGSFREACEIFAENNELSHGVIDGEVMGALFPEYKNIPHDGEPETLMNDQGWISTVINGVHKSPISRVRTRQLDARTGLRANGYKTGHKKEDMGDVELIKRTTDPQTVYVKDKMNRDDIIDFTDFDIVAYQYKIMRSVLNEEVATAILVGDGRSAGDEMKISEAHIRSIWKDDELYTIHQDIDIAAQKAALNGTDTAANFGDSYVYAESIISASLFAREKYKGSGNLTFFCTPHLLNVMLLARDLNGRRIYSSKADLQAALNVKEIQTVEQFEGLVRTDSENNDHALLGIFVNLADYTTGSTKGGEITTFNQFDIDFNQEKFLIETRLSGALTKIKSAIVLEEPVQA